MQIESIIYEENDFGCTGEIEVGIILFAGFAGVEFLDQGDSPADLCPRNKQSEYGPEKRQPGKGDKKSSDGTG